MESHSGVLLLKVQAVSLAFHVSEREPTFKAVSQTSCCLPAQKAEDYLLLDPLIGEKTFFICSAVCLSVHSLGALQVLSQKNFHMSVSFRLNEPEIPPHTRHAQYR